MIWNGVFSPKISKTIGTVRFVPLHEMGDKDWIVLEFPNLRDAAKDRIANMMVSGKLIGFFQVNILEKAKAKLRYYWSADEDMVDEFGQTLDGEDATFFRNEQDVEVIGDNAFYVDGLINEFSNEFIYPKTMVIAILVLAVKKASEIVLEKHQYHERLIKDFTNGQDLEYECYFLLVTFLLAVYGREGLDAQLKKIEESWQK